MSLFDEFLIPCYHLVKLYFLEEKLHNFIRIFHGAQDLLKKLSTKHHFSINV